jgi:NifU-like protein
MWDYSETVKDHFFSPRNAGAIKDANATGEVGSISCGDALRLTLQVDPVTEVILDAGFQTFGCGSAIASSSALTEIIKGKTVSQALQVTNQDIADYLGGLPQEKMHCSVMGREALQAAVANFRGETWVNDHEEGALVCKCFAVDAVKIEQTIRDNKLRTVEEITYFTKAGGGCCACHEGIEGLLNKILAETGDAPSVTIAPPAKPAVPVPAIAAQAAPKGMNTLQRLRRIEMIIESIRPQLQRDHGDVELVDIDNNVVYVNMVGACSSCQMASATLGGIQQRLMEELGEFIKVVPASQQAQMNQAGA